MRVLDKKALPTTMLPVVSVPATPVAVSKHSGREFGRRTRKPDLLSVFGATVGIGVLGCVARSGNELCLRWVPWLERLGVARLAVAVPVMRQCHARHPLPGGLLALGVALLAALLAGLLLALGVMPGLLLALGVALLAALLAGLLLALGVMPGLLLALGVALLAAVLLIVVCIGLLVGTPAARPVAPGRICITLFAHLLVMTRGPRLRLRAGEACVALGNIAAVVFGTEATVAALLLILVIVCIGLLVGALAARPVTPNRIGVARLALFRVVTVLSCL
mmetsp:Transcript_4614/g.14819  ORF Transcript_4614/g.14819 Transcript_4614/m.14819 type:complete len:278 (-) Transcript_4614:333-1166(-)